MITKRASVALAGIFILAVSILPGCGMLTQAADQNAGLAQELTPTAAIGAPPGRQEARGQQLLTGTIADVVETVRPAVVFISVRTLSPGTFLQPVPREGVGSGVIYDPSGLILTNNHVIDNAQRIRVVLADGRTFEANVLGRDPLTDIAVLKIEGENLPTARLGSSAALRVGQWVVAIGNALGLEGGPTVTEGIVSALDRSLEDPAGPALDDLIQTSAAINPGDSGGPLVNLDGEVVGINTAVPGPTARGLQPTGIGFAIAIDAAKPIISELVRQGRVLRPFLGIDTATVTPALAAHLDLVATEGALVTEVGVGTPAAQAGLQVGDVIVVFGGTVVTNARELRHEVMQRGIGEEVEISVLRNGTQIELSVVLGERPEPPELGR